MCCYFYFKSLSERTIIIALTFIKEGYLDKLNLGNLLLLSISFRSIMGFAKHLAITFICGSTFVFGLPLTELCSTDRVDTITNRNDCIEVVELRHVILTICGSCRVFLGNWIFNKFSTLEDVIQMQSDIICWTIKKHCHCFLCCPYRFIFI